MDWMDLERFISDNPQTWLYCAEYADAYSIYSDLDTVINDYKLVDENTREFQIQQNELLQYLDSCVSDAPKQKFDSRTYTRPKKRNLNSSLPDSLGNATFNLSGTKTITKYSKAKIASEMHLFQEQYDSSNFSNDNLDSDIPSLNSSNLNDTFQVAADDFSDHEDRGDDLNSTFSLKPISFNLQEPVHNIHNSFNARFSGYMNQADSFSNISPPSLVSSIMDGSGTFSRQGSMRKEVNDDYDDHTAHNSIGSSMTTSILDEKEMSTSFLSQAGNYDNHNYLDEMSTNVLDTFDFTSMRNSMIKSNNFQIGKDRNSMESSMINSITFDNMIDSTDDPSFNDKSKFRLRSFLKSESDDQDKVNMYLKSHSASMKGNSLNETFDKDDLNSTFKVNDANSSDLFLLDDKMSESFLKSTGRNTSFGYNRMSGKVNDNQENVLPNQTQSTNTMLLNRRTNGTPDAKNSPKRNLTFRKNSPPNLSVPDSRNDGFEDKPEFIDSNKESYMNKSAGDECISDYSPQHISKRMDAGDKHYSDGRAMTGSSSDSLDCSSNSERSPPQPTTVPLSMEDLEYLAYQQHQSLLQDVSTPLPKSTKTRMTDSLHQFKENMPSPIMSGSKDTLSSSTCSTKSISPMDSNKYGTYRLNSSSTGSLNRMSTAYNNGISSPKRVSNVKRESSAPEIVGMDPPNLKGALGQRYPLNSSQKGLLKQDERYISDSGLQPNKRLYSNAPKLTYSSNYNQSPVYNRTLTKYKHSPQLSGSTTELRSKQCGLPASKLRQYSSHRELNRISGPLRRPISNLQTKSSLHSSNPALFPAQLKRQGSYTISVENLSPQNDRRDFVKPTVPSKEVIKPNSNQFGMKVTNPINTGVGLQYGQPPRAKYNIPSLSTPNKINAAQNPGIINPNIVKPATTSTVTQSNSVMRAVNPTGPSNAANTRLPRPSGLPRPASGIPRKSALRPTSTYSLAPRTNDQADCY